MASSTLCSGISILVFYTVLSLYSYETMGERDKYRDIQKRIFCNMAGCGNMQGKRDYIKSRKIYNMFNRPVGKRSPHAAVPETPTMAGEDKLHLDTEYANWSPNQYDTLDPRAAVPEYEDDSSLNYFPSEDTSRSSRQFYSNPLGTDQYSLNEKYQLLKAAEDLLHYVNTLARTKVQRSKSSAPRSFNSDWSGKRK